MNLLTAIVCSAFLCSAFMCSVMCSAICEVESCVYDIILFNMLQCKYFVVLCTCSAVELKCDIAVQYTGVHKTKIRLMVTIHSKDVTEILALYRRSDIDFPPHFLVRLMHSFPMMYNTI